MANVSHLLPFVASALYGVISRPSDFATYFLAVLIINFLSSLFYYWIAKVAQWLTGYV